MIIKCICINCEFYFTCWINNASANFPMYYKSLTNFKKIRFIGTKYNSLSFLPTFIHIQLNMNSENYKAEPDIIFCDSFIEKPGNWII